MNSTAQITLGILGSGGLLAVVVAIINAVSGRDVRKADAAKELADGVAVLIGPIKKELVDTRESLKAAEVRAERQQKQIDALTLHSGQVDELVKAVSALTRLAEVAAPLLAAADHHDLAARLTDAAATTEAAIPKKKK